MDRRLLLEVVLSDSAQPSHVLVKLLGLSKATDVSEWGMLAASQRPAGLTVGMSALMGELGTHAFALFSEPKNRPKSDTSKF